MNSLGYTSAQSHSYTGYGLANLLVWKGGIWDFHDSISVSLILASWRADKSFWLFEALLPPSWKSYLTLGKEVRWYLKPTLLFLAIYRLRISLCDPSASDGRRRPAYCAMSQLMGPSVERESEWFLLDRYIELFIRAAPKSHTWTRRLQYQFIFRRNVAVCL
jgi:hypothetical protein